MAQRRTDAVGAPEPTPCDDEVAGLALALLDRLPREQRAAIAAHVVAGHGYREIARYSGVSEAGVRQRVSRGLGHDAPAGPGAPDGRGRPATRR